MVTAGKFKKRFSGDEHLDEKMLHFKLLHNEFKALGVGEGTVFVVVGADAKAYLHEYFRLVQPGLADVARIVEIKHCSLRNQPGQCKEELDYEYYDTSSISLTTDTNGFEPVYAYSADEGLDITIREALNR